MKRREKQVSALILILLFLFASLPALAQDTITLQELRELLELQTDERELIQLVQASDGVEGTEAQLVQLREGGASDALIAAVRDKMQTDLVGWVLSRAATGASDERLLEEVLSRGEVVFLAASDKLRLRRAGVSMDVLRALEGTYVLQGFRVYQDPLGMLAMQYREGWHTYLWYTGEGVKILLSPEAGVTAPNKFTTGLQLQLSFLPESSVYLRRGFDQLAYYKSALPSWLRLNRSYEPSVLSEPKEVPVGGGLGVEQRLELTMMGTRCRELLRETVARQTHYFMEAVAPLEKFEALEPTFRKMLQSFRSFPGQAPLTRRPAALRGDQALELYREAVVMIVATFQGWQGYGSGFLVRDDGYLLTNHHVICGDENHLHCDNPQNWLLPEKLEVLWDARVQPKAEGETHRRAPATLVATHFSSSPHIDAALLKLPPASQPYPAIPISTIGSGLSQEGDPIVVLGFPMPDKMGIGNLFVTAGTIARINYLERPFGKEGQKRELDNLWTDAVTNPGNSGGPVVNLMTGAVFGLHTIGSYGQTHNPWVENLRYGGATLLDHVLEQFPQVQWYPKGKPMSGQDHLELGVMLLSKGNHRPAETEFMSALDALGYLIPEQRARLFHQLACLYSEAGLAGAAGEMLAKSMAQHDEYTLALIDMAYVHTGEGRIDQAMSLIDKVVELEPDRWLSWYYRADMYRLAAEYDQALAATRKALELGAHNEPSLHRLRGVIHYQQGDEERSLAAFGKAAEVDPADFMARIEIARCHAREDRHQAALLAYGRALADFPNEAAVSEAYGRYLLTREGRQTEAVDRLAHAVWATLDQGDRPQPKLLYDLGAHALEVPEGEGLARAFAAAKLLYGDWASWRSEACKLLGNVWEQLGWPELANVHLLAAGETGWGGLLRFDELDQLRQASYSPLLLSELLMNANIASAFGEEQMEAFEQWPPDYQQLIALRFLEDQSLGGTGLARQLSFEWAGELQTDDTISAYGDLTIHNSGSLPLSGLYVRMIYYDEQMNEVWSRSGELLLDDPTFRPGMPRTIQFQFDPWSTLAANGLSTDQVSYYTLEFTWARNALFLDDVPCLAEEVVDGQGFQFQLRNNTPFRMAQSRVKCTFWDSEGRPLLDAEGMPLVDYVDLETPLDPEQATTVLVPEWIDFDYLRQNLGLSPDTTTFSLDAQVVDVVFE